MTILRLVIELTQKFSTLVDVAQVGTVDTRLYHPFQRSVGEGQLISIDAFAHGLIKHHRTSVT
mgnify:CR=1 FL=1